MVSSAAVVIGVVTIASSVLAKPLHDDDHYEQHTKGLLDSDHQCESLTQYAYDNIGKLAYKIKDLTKQSNQDFLKAHAHAMLESTTAKAIGDYFGKINYVKNYGGEECLANKEEDALKDFRKRHAKVVFDCEAGWQLNTELGTEMQATLKTLQDLDGQAKEVLKNCNSESYCYNQFRSSALGQSIDKTLSDIRQTKMVDIQVMWDVGRMQSLGRLARCNADNTNELRKDIYTAIATLNVCAANAGLLPDF